MTTKRTYECNLCRSPIDSAGNGRGFAFGHKRLDWKALYEAENHLCDTCVDRLIISLRDPGIVEDHGRAA